MGPISNSHSFHPDTLQHLFQVARSAGCSFLTFNGNRTCGFFPSIRNSAPSQAAGYPSGLLFQLTCALLCRGSAVSRLQNKIQGEPFSEEHVTRDDCYFKIGRHYCACGTFAIPITSDSDLYTVNSITKKNPQLPATIVFCSCVFPVVGATCAVLASPQLRR